MVLETTLKGRSDGRGASCENCMLSSVPSSQSQWRIYEQWKIFTAPCMVVGSLHGGCRGVTGPRPIDTSDRVRCFNPRAARRKDWPGQGWLPCHEKVCQHSSRGSFHPVTSDDRYHDHGSLTPSYKITSHPSSSNPSSLNTYASSTFVRSQHCYSAIHSQRQAR